MKYFNLEGERFIQISLFLSSGHNMLALAGWWTKWQVINRQSFKILLKFLQRKGNFEEIGSSAVWWHHQFSIAVALIIISNISLGFNISLWFDVPQVCTVWYRYGYSDAEILLFYWRTIFMRNWSRWKDLIINNKMKRRYMWHMFRCQELSRYMYQISTIYTYWYRCHLCLSLS